MLKALALFGLGAVFALSSEVSVAQRGMARARIPEFELPASLEQEQREQGSRPPRGGVEASASWDVIADAARPPEFVPEKQEWQHKLTKRE
jgi:hypothetical protein